MQSSLLELPPELLVAVFDDLVHDVGIRPAVKLRTVCSAFDRFLLSAIYALPSFEDEYGDCFSNDKPSEHTDTQADDASHVGNGDHEAPSTSDKYPSRLCWDPRMSKPLVVGLIKARLNLDRSRRPLLLAISDTINAAKHTLRCFDQDAYEDALVRLAADKLPLHRITNGLSNHEAKHMDRRNATQPELLGNALAAALFLDKSSDVEHLLGYGATIDARTKWFGDVVEVAACHSAISSIELVLNAVFSCWQHLGESKLSLEKPDDWRRTFAGSRLIFALERAAFHGRSNIFSPALWQNLRGKVSWLSCDELFVSAIQSAVLAGRSDTLEAIASLASAMMQSETDAKCAVRLPIDALRTASSNGAAPLVKTLLEHLPYLGGHLEFCIEAACRAGHIQIYRLLSDYQEQQAVESQRSAQPSSLRGAMYWAGRRRDYDMLSLISTRCEATKTSWLDALAGASIHGMKEMSHLLQRFVGIELQHSALELTFAQVVDELIPSIVDEQVPGSRRLHSSDSSESRLNTACEKGDWLTLHCLLSESSADARRIEALPCRQGAWDGAASLIRHARAAALQYLCEQLPGELSLETLEEVIEDNRTESSSIIQVLLDKGLASGDGMGRPHWEWTDLDCDELLRWSLNLDEDPYGARPGSCTLGIIGQTRLSGAIEMESLSTIFSVLRAGGDPRLGTCLHNATMRESGDQFAVMDLLVSYGVSIDTSSHDTYGYYPSSMEIGTPLQAAAHDWKRDVVAYLLQKGANPSVVNMRELRQLSEEKVRRDVEFEQEIPAELRRLGEGKERTDAEFEEEIPAGGGMQQIWRAMKEKERRCCESIMNMIESARVSQTGSHE